MVDFWQVHPRYRLVLRQPTTPIPCKWIKWEQEAKPWDDCAHDKNLGWSSTILSSTGTQFERKKSTTCLLVLVLLQSFNIFQSLWKLKAIESSCYVLLITPPLHGKKECITSSVVLFSDPDFSPWKNKTERQSYNLLYWLVHATMKVYIMCGLVLLPDVNVFFLHIWSVVASLL